MFNWYDLYIAREKAERLYAARKKAFDVRMNSNKEEYDYDNKNSSLSESKTIGELIGDSIDAEFNTATNADVDVYEIYSERLRSGEIYDISHILHRD